MLFPSSLKRTNFRLALLSMLVILVMLGFSGRFLLGIYEVSGERVALVDHIIRLQRMQSDLRAAESSQRGYLITGNSTFKEQFEFQSLRIAEHQSFIADTPSSPAIRGEDVRRLTDLANQRLQALTEGIADYGSDDGEAARSNVQNGPGNLLMEEFSALTSTLSRVEHDRLDALRDQTLSHSNKLLYMLVLGGGMNVLLLAIICITARDDRRMQQRLLGQSRRASAEVSLLNDMNSSLLACTRQDEACKVARHYLELMFPGTEGGLFLYKASRNLLELQMTWGEQEFRQHDTLLTEECWALRRGRTHMYRSESDLHCAHRHENQKNMTICLPMIAQTEIIGLLSIHCDASIRGSGPEDLAEARHVMETVAAQIAGAMANLRLRDALQAQSMKDMLTGLFNRRYLEETLDREELRAKRNQTPIGIIMLDIDNFKSFNDNHGHEAGDRVLAAVGEVLRTRTRGEDIACRYGGEEFTIVLPGADLATSMARANELRAAIAQIQIRFDDKVLSLVTASLGVACFPLHGEAWREVLQEADAALYKAKHEGRNRVVEAIWT